MKNQMKLVLLLSALIFSGLAKANETTTDAPADPSAMGIELTPIVGGTYFSIEGSDDELLSDGGKSGVVAGVLAGYNLGAVSVESGLLYLETGASYGGLLASLDTTISYLALPLLVKAPILQVDEVNFYARGGALLGVKMDAKVEGSGLLEGSTADINDSINSFNAMGQLGLGGDYQLQPNITVGGELAFIRGFTDVVKDAGGYSQGYSAAVTLSISI